MLTFRSAKLCKRLSMSFELALDDDSVRWSAEVFCGGGGGLELLVIVALLNVLL